MRFKLLSNLNRYRWNSWRRFATAMPIFSGYFDIHARGAVQVLVLV